MNKLDDKQLKQIKHVSNTLLEATEHLANLVKEKNLNQTIFILSSIVDGFSSINNVLKEAEIGIKERDKIEKSLNLIVKELEKGRMIKASEIVQFSLMPQTRKWNNVLNDFTESGIDNKEMIIGVYLCQDNPRKVYPEGRINALVDEGYKQGAKVIFFSSEDVNFEKKEVMADVYKDSKWVREIHPFPNVINNIPKSRIQQSYTERRLRKEIPFTGFGIHGKIQLPKKLIETKKYYNLLVPFKVADNINKIHDFLEKHNNAVLKPVRGRQGLNIYFITKKEDRFILLDHKRKQTLSKDEFNYWLKEKIISRNKLYIIQEYLRSQTSQGEPFDIRAHVQKDGNGNWQLTKIYPRIGNKKSILSNISRGGRTEVIETFLKKEFSNKWRTINSDLKELSLGIAIHLDKVYGSALDELGLDLAIDNNGNYWMHEANLGPQTSYHENERAINTVSYALYLANNGLFLTNQFERMKNKKEFNALNSDLKIAELDKDRVKIGMLVSKNEVDKLAEACAYVAKYEEQYFYYFTPRDIDFDERLIRGYFYINKEWVPKIVEYPDVIYDRLRARGLKGFNKIYEELGEIPFTNEFFGNSISKLEVYDKLSSVQSLTDYIIPYKKVNRIKDIFQYIEKYEKVILKPEIGSFAKGVHFISKLNNGQYFLSERDTEKNYDEISITNYLLKLIKNGNFIVQKYINTRTLEGNPFDIRVHMMKDFNGDWSFVKTYPRIGFNYATISSTLSGGYIGNLSGFLKRNFSKALNRSLTKEIQSISINTANAFEALYNINFSEIALDIAIDNENKPYIIEVNVNKPGIANYEFELAQLAIPYAALLGKNK